MSNANPSTPSPEEVQRARAAHLRELFEPWSLRKLAARTGLSKGVVDSRMSGATPLTMPDFEVLAPVIRMTPSELFEELLKLPHLDSNQEPIGSAPEEPIGELVDLGRHRRRRRVESTPASGADTSAIVSSIGRHA